MRKRLVADSPLPCWGAAERGFWPGGVRMGAVLSAAILSAEEPLIANPGEKCGNGIPKGKARECEPVLAPALCAGYSPRTVQGSHVDIQCRGSGAEDARQRVNRNRVVIYDGCRFAAPLLVQTLRNRALGALWYASSRCGGWLAAAWVRVREIGDVLLVVRRDCRGRPGILHSVRGAYSKRERS